MDPRTEREIARLRQIEEMRPRKGAILLVIPIVSVVLVAVLYVGMFTLGIRGRAADGERVTMEWEGCPEAAPILRARVERMGLGDPQLEVDGRRIRLTATLPAEPDVAAQIPHTLARRGILRAYEASTPATTLFTNADIVDVGIRQDLTLMPWTVLTLTEEARLRLQEVVLANREGRVHYTLDGEPIGSVSNLKGAPVEVELTPEGTDDRDRMHKAAARTVILASGPLPCALVPASGT